MLPIQEENLDDGDFRNVEDEHIGIPWEVSASLV